MNQSDGLIRLSILWAELDIVDVHAERADRSDRRGELDAQDRARVERDATSEADLRQSLERHAVRAPLGVDRDRGGERVAVGDVSRQQPNAELAASGRP